MQKKKDLKKQFKNINNFEELQEFLRELYKYGRKLETKRGGNIAHTFRKYRGNDKKVIYHFRGQDYDGKSDIENLHKHLKISK